MKVRRALYEERGQTATEYLMILGLVTVMITSLEKIVIPAIRYVVTVLVMHMATCISSVYPGCVAK
jgi:Flp pilus assembly pilin Flp